MAYGYVDSVFTSEYRCRLFVVLHAPSYVCDHQFTTELFMYHELCPVPQLFRKGLNFVDNKHTLPSSFTLPFWMHTLTWS